MRNAANVSLALHRSKGGLAELPVAIQEFVKMKENAA